MVGCGGGGSCNTVLSSRWSIIAGVLPVSGLAMGVYLAMLIAGLYIGPATEISIRRLAWRALLILAGAIIGSALWFTYLQIWVIGDFCIYCMSTHATDLLLAVLLIWRAIREHNDHSDAENVKRHGVNHIRTLSPAIIGLVLAGMLAIGQISFSSSSPSVYSNGKSQKNLPVLDYHAAPMIGSPDAPYIVTLLFDYDCPHCQKLHTMLHKAISLYNGKLAFALCSTPLNTHCNPYIPRDVDEFKNSCKLARIGLAVWYANRKAFPKFDNWMYANESGNSWHPRSPENARAKAVELVGQKKFEAALSDPRIERYMHTCIRIFGQTLRNGSGGVPKLIFGQHWVIPAPRNVSDLVKILHNSLGIPMP